jgi:hypothetical protein
MKTLFPEATRFWLSGWRIPASADDKQSHKGDQTENQKKDLEQAHKGVENHVECIPGQGKESAVHAVDPIARKGADQRGENQQSAVENRAPHEKNSQDLKIHNPSPLFGIGWARISLNKTAVSCRGHAAKQIGTGQIPEALP